MYIFYDFETSSRELVGQILSYSFIVTDKSLTQLEELNGLIRLNRLQVPEKGAILTNRINISMLQEKGDTEYEAANKIHTFLSKCVQTYKKCTLVGFNSNQFDLSFLRNTLIRYGINPYYGGKLQNLDILHFAQHVAFQNTEKFPWIKTDSKKSSYYSFKLEDIASEFGLLQEAQSHDAREDVLLTIRVVQAMEHFFNVKFSNFSPIHYPSDVFYQGRFEVAKQKTRHFVPLGESPDKYTSTYWLKLADIKKAKLVINLSKLKELTLEKETLSTEDKLSVLKYVNPNKHFFVLEPLQTGEWDTLSSLESLIAEDSFFMSLQKDPGSYFSLLEKTWDIDYQIHELGFERIDALKHYTQKLFKAPDSYPQLLKTLLDNRSDKKDNYLIQLFNRAYLNYHPNPNPDYIFRYVKPRYIDGTMLRNSEDFEPLLKQIEEITIQLENDEGSLEDQVLLKSLLNYMNDFKSNYINNSVLN
jgi:hypothetical protein